MTAAPERLFTPRFVALTLSELCYFTAGGLLIGLTTFFVTGPIGSDESAVAIVTAAFTVSTLLLRPYAGRISDRRGRRPLLIGGAALFAVALIGHLVATDLVVLVILRVLWGVAEAMYFVAALAALADLAPPGRMGEALSINSLALYVGLALGPLLGQLMLEVGGFPAAWITGFALAVAATVLAAWLPETATRGEEHHSESSGFLHRAAIGPGLALFTGTTAMSGYLILVGPFARDAGLDAWSITFLLFGAVVIVLRIAFATLPDRVPPLRLGGFALALAGAGLAVVAVTSGVVGLLAGTMLLAAGVAFMTPALFAATFARVGPADRGLASGTMSLFIDLGFGAGPFVMGFVAAASGTPLAFVIGAAVAICGAAATLVATRRGEGRVAA
jgi:predicted MFS family arabinose efflux permease